MRTLDGVFTPAALRAVIGLEEVKRHIDSGRFGKRRVYIITGLRVAVDSFTVTDEKATKVSGSLGGSGPVPAGGVPIEVGGALSGANERTSNRSYQTAPGIVFAYRLHVVRPKSEDDAEGKLFVHRTAFLTGEAGEGDDEEAEEMEFVAVDAETARDDLDVGLKAFSDEQKLEEGDEESYVVMN